MRGFLLTVLCLAAARAADDPKEIVRRALEADARNEAVSRNYTFLEREDIHIVDNSGKTKSRKLRTWDVTLLEGSPYRRLVMRDDKPLPPDDENKEQEKLRKSIEQRRGESPEQRQARIADWERKRDAQRAHTRELADVYDFHLAGEQQIDRDRVWMIDAAPHPGYKPHSKTAEFLAKMKGRLYIAQSDYHWVRAEMETLDTISIGAFLLRIGKGGRIVIDQAHVNDEVWLPKHIQVNAAAKVLLLKGLRLNFDYAFSNYKKFQAESRIVGN